MKNILKNNLILLVVIILGSIVRNQYIIGIFPQEQQGFLIITSNLTSILSSLFAILIYSIIFYLAYQLSIILANPIETKIYFKAINNTYIALIILEVFKIVMTLIFLEDSLIDILPNENIGTELNKTIWYKFQIGTNVMGAALIPLIVFLNLKEENISNKVNLQVSFSILTCILLFGLFG
jgi:hypothetical protein